MASRSMGEDGSWSTARLPQARLVRALTVAAWGVGLMHVSGCAETEFGPRLAFAIPQKFESATTVKAPNVSRWWTRFQSAELNGLMDVANIENLDIAAAVAQLKQADAQAQITGAALWPALAYSESSQRLRSSGSTAAERNSFNKVINASYIVDVWGQNRDALEVALRTASASAYQVEVVRLATRASVVDNFLIYAANRERTTVATENLRNAERLLGVIRQRQAVGTASELDIAQQQSLVEIQRASIPPLRQATEAARTALAILIGKPVQAVQLTTRGVRRLRLPTVAPGLPTTLLVRRPDIRSAEQNLAAADANVAVARKAFLPSIQLTGQAGFQSSVLSALLRPESFIYAVAAGVTQPIFEGGRLRGQLALNEAQRQQLLESYRKSIVSALTDVENALVAVRENAARETAQRVAVLAARRALDLSEERLRQGTIDLTTLLNTQNTLFQAEDTLIQIRLARLQAAASLYQALGGDWEEPVAAPPVP
ncbi:MAG TPA: efflux transporter outer membrane subunit [Hyphomicrobiaceae bacterium]|nr:efflux transporter outer membrane subunit [Hyphomicrobiaceae bacterium]